MVSAVVTTLVSALGWVHLEYNHIALALPTFVFVIFAQAFVMFYFIGVNRLTENVYNVLNSKNNLHELFDAEKIPENLDEYKHKVYKYCQHTSLCKRQTIPWTMLMLILGSLGFLLGGAHHTGLVRKIIHSGVIYGFIVAMFIGFVRQWYYLGKTHTQLGEMKALFGISRDQM
jgi:hypothetical protein